MTMTNNAESSTIRGATACTLTSSSSVMRACLAAFCFGVMTLSSYANPQNRHRPSPRPFSFALHFGRCSPFSPLLKSRTVHVLSASSAPRQGKTKGYDVRFSPNRWPGELVEPGFGGPWPGDPNAKRYNVTVLREDTGERFEMQVPQDRYIFHYFEEEGVLLPIHNVHRMCRNGCCTTCAAKVKAGSVKLDAALGLLRELQHEGYALLCCSYPRSDLVVSLIDEDEVYLKQWGQSFESGGVEWGGLLPEED